MKHLLGAERERVQPILLSQWTGWTPQVVWITIDNFVCWPLISLRWPVNLKINSSLSSNCSKEFKINQSITITSVPWNTGHARDCLLLLLRWGRSHLAWWRILPTFVSCCPHVARIRRGGVLTWVHVRRLLDDKVVLDVVLVVHIHNVDLQALSIAPT